MIKKNLTPLIVLVVTVFILLFNLERYDRNYFLWDDNADSYLPSYSYNWDSLIKTKTIPFVNFHQFLGVPHFSQGETGVLYPPIYLAVLLSILLIGNISFTIDMLVILHLTAASVAMFLLLRKLEISKTLCFF